MLGFWRSHKHYQSFVLSNLSSLPDKNLILEYQDIISKLYILDLDLLLPIVAPLYSSLGRPALVQPEIFRALILANHLAITLDCLPEKLLLNKVLRIAAGFDDHNQVRIASYYDFINRIIKIDEKPRLKLKKRKPSKKIGKGKKLPSRDPGVVSRLVNRIIEKDDSFDLRPEKKLQEIFSGVCVKQSIDIGIIDKSLSVSGDGTCIKTGASSYGVRTCDCFKHGIYNCHCPRRFSDPNATWGWDSHNEQWFYGYSGYFISTYNKDLKIDLPIYLRLVEASRHDSVSAVVALSEFRKLYPHLTINTFISDSASDNYATYELLKFWGINAVIALSSLNKGNFKYPGCSSFDENGTPICPGSNKMTYYGYCKNRHRIKWRCPRVCGKPYLDCHNCSPSAYGRVVYTKPSWDLRLFTTIPRGTQLWKEKMNSRTSSERINNRILNDYNIENSRIRGKKRISFFTTIAGFNIHLDAQLKVLKASGKFNFHSIFSLNSVA